MAIAQNTPKQGFTPGPWLSRRWAAKRALEEKRLLELAREERHRKQLSQFKPKREGPDSRQAADWNPLALLFGVLLGSWFG